MFESEPWSICFSRESFELKTKAEIDEVYKLSAQKSKVRNVCLQLLETVKDNKELAAYCEAVVQGNKESVALVNFEDVDDFSDGDGPAMIGRNQKSLRASLVRP